MHDLDAVAVLQTLRRVSTARHDGLVEFDGNATVGVAAVGEQVGNGGLGRKLFLHAIEQDVHDNDCNAGRLA